MEHIKDLLSRIMTHCRLEVAIVKMLEEQQQEIYALKEKVKLLEGASNRSTKEIADLRMILRQKVSV